MIISSFKFFSFKNNNTKKAWQANIQPNIFILDNQIYNKRQKKKEK